MLYLLAASPHYILSLQFLYVVLVLFPAMALLSVLRNVFTKSKRQLWITVIILLPVIGPLLYLFIGREERLNKFCDY